METKKSIKIPFKVLIAFIIIVAMIIISFVFVLNKNNNEADLKSPIEKSNLEEVKKVQVFYKESNGPTNLVNINIMLTEEDATNILNMLNNTQYSKITGLMWDPQANYVIDLFNGTQIIYDNDNIDNNIVQYKNQNEEFFTEIPIEVKQIISKYIKDKY